MHTDTQEQASKKKHLSLSRLCLWNFFYVFFAHRTKRAPDEILKGGCRRGVRGGVERVVFHSFPESLCTTRVWESEQAGVIYHDCYAAVESCRSPLAAAVRASCATVAASRKRLRLSPRATPRVRWPSAAVNCSLRGSASRKIPSPSFARTRGTQ